jgi:hypothetical protein
MPRNANVERRHSNEPGRGFQVVRNVGELPVEGPRRCDELAYNVDDPERDEER